MTLTLDSWLRRSRRRAFAKALREEPPPRSSRIPELVPRGTWQPKWEREGLSLEAWLGICADLDCEE